MPGSGYLHRHAEFGSLIRIVAELQRIDPYLAEKDYWVMHCLHGLQRQGFEFQLKGGTSLSKGHGLIYRFSEDIDIHIEPRSDLDLKTGRNHNKPHHVEARKSYYDDLAGKIAIDGIRPERDTVFDDRYCRSGGIQLVFESQFQPPLSSAKRGVLLELGFDDMAPNKPFDITSWVYDYAIEQGAKVLDNRAKGVACYEAGYTLVEKLQAIATKYRHFRETGDIPASFMRHYYDVHCLLGSNEVLRFADTEAFEIHRAKRFPKQDLDIPLRENQAFLLEDEEEFKRLESEFVASRALYYNGQPAFEDVMGSIRTWVRGRASAG